ncbi:hypothetical protein PILCRDRAFT_315327 [Piloderma croceum F 1598]|uniref:Uncharacterized protein n=1 Tax=Piloderma croceum (strain F 1598) TaxID=765440 RepID=A0A0C3CAQ5_PILCF|nr:hypothetical protein PILCRDRAFT_315327 [Piloderma croceum F 1598]
MPRAASNQQGPPHGDHPATNANPTPRSSYGNPTSRSYQPATHYTYPPINQLNHPNSAVSVSATHLSESIVHRLSPGLNAAFSMLHQNTLTQINNVQNSIQSLSKNLSDARAEAKKESTQVTNILEASHALQTKAIKRVIDRVDKLDKTIGGNDGISLIRRISSIEFAIAELVERMRDPDAAVVPIIRRDAAISPRPEILPSKRISLLVVHRRSRLLFHPSGLQLMSI